MKERNLISCQYGEPALIRRKRAGEPRRSTTTQVADKGKDSGRIVQGQCGQIAYPGRIPDRRQRAQYWRKKVNGWEIVHKIIKSASQQRTVNAAAVRWRKSS